jgi:cytochrome c oxidase cbb3-type subunit 2
MRKKDWLTLAVFLGVAAAVLSLVPFATPFEATLNAQGVEGTPTPMSDDALIEQGEMLYNDFCAACHQPEGQGVPGGAGFFVAPLDGSEFVTAEPEGLLMAILGGYGPMPGFRGSLTNEELAAIASYIRTAWSNDASIVHPEDVAALNPEEQEP